MTFQPLLHPAAAQDDKSFPAVPCSLNTGNNKKITVTLLFRKKKKRKATSLKLHTRSTKISTNSGLAMKINNTAI